MTIRRATSADLEALARIQAGAPEAARWDPADYLDQVCYVAVTEGGRAGGFLVLRSVAPGEHEILDLAVDPALRRCGLASALVAEAGRLHPGLYFLEVRASNLAARAFYGRAGFAEQGRRRSYYRDPSEDAVLMSGRLGL